MHDQPVGGITFHKDLTNFLKGGFTQIPNPILTSDVLTAQHKLMYSLLLHYAWQQGSCFPGQARLAKEMGCGIRQVRRHLKDLENKRLINIITRGKRHTNLYVLLAPPQWLLDSAH